MISREAVQFTAATAFGAVVSAVAVGLFFSFRCPKPRRPQNDAVQHKSSRQSPFDPSKRKGYLSWDDYFMAIAFLSAERSKDPNRQVGACLVSENGIILGIGYNGFPRGCSDDKLPWSKKSKNGDPLETKYP
ncbi:Cytidine/deoxycytidylate deaminase family protein [Striga hermonthica]|uniref:dCMP deaminase n=1 Tax=Striga hermonthica TaxID=68872 RepID=A0A9N7NU28_STRHE|nr:Cytidine/deoxycytidylate deaminase family protein [Striga hermonthica]